MRALLAIAALLATSTAYSFDQNTNEVLSYLDGADVSYIAKVEDGALIIRVVSGSVNVDNVRDAARLVGITVKLVDRDGLDLN